MKKQTPSMMLKPIHAFAFALFCGCLTPAPATEGLLTDDSTVFSASAPGTYGDSATLLVNSVTTKCMVLRFEIASMLPAGIKANQIATATLRLFTAAAPTGTGTVSVYKVLSSKSWTEANATGVWAAGTDYDATAVLSAIPVTTFALNQYVAMDVTSAVKSWIATPGSNNGLIFRPSGTISLTFQSKESTTMGHNAVLDITLIPRTLPLGDVGMLQPPSGPLP